MCHSNPQQGTPPCVSASHVTQGTNPRNLEVQMRGWICGRHQHKYYDTYSLPLKPLYFISISYKTQYSTPQIIFLTQREGVQFLTKADCCFQILLQPRSENHPLSYPKATLGYYPNNKFSGTVTVLRLRICEVLMPCLYRDNLHFIQETSRTESIMEDLHIRTPHTKIL